MNKVLYSFNVYFKNPMNQWYVNGSSSVAMQWDTIVTIYGSNLEDAIKNLPEEYEDYNIVKVEYPIGYPNFPILPLSTCSLGVVGVNLNGNNYLRKV